MTWSNPGHKIKLYFFFSKATMKLDILTKQTEIDKIFKLTSHNKCSCKQMSQFKISNGGGPKFLGYFPNAIWGFIKKKHIFVLWSLILLKIHFNHKIIFISPHRFSDIILMIPQAIYCHTRPNLKFQLSWKTEKS